MNPLQDSLEEVVPMSNDGFIVVLSSVSGVGVMILPHGRGYLLLDPSGQLLESDLVAGLGHPPSLERAEIKHRPPTIRAPRDKRPHTEMVVPRKLGPAFSQVRGPRFRRR